MEQKPEPASEETVAANADPVVNPENWENEADLGGPIDEMTMLKARAKMMGIPHSNNIGLEALKKKIADRMEGKAPEPEPRPNPLALPDDPSSVQSMGEVKKQKISLRKYIRDREMKLVRLRITNLDPKKKDLPGEIFTVGNRFLGTVRKFVPFGEVTEEGWHVPYCIYKMMKRRTFLNIRVQNVRTANGTQLTVRQGWVKEFALEVLPQITEKERQRLAAAQAAAGGIGSDA